MSELTREAVINTFRDAHQDADDQVIVNQIAARARVENKAGNALYKAILAWMGKSEDSHRRIAMIDVVVLSVMLSHYDDEPEEDHSQLVRALLIERNILITETGQSLSREDAESAWEDSEDAHAAEDPDYARHKEQLATQFFERFDRLSDESGLDTLAKLAEASGLSLAEIEQMAAKRQRWPMYRPNLVMRFALSDAFGVELAELEGPTGEELEA